MFKFLTNRKYTFIDILGNVTMILCAEKYGWWWLLLGLPFALLNGILIGYDEIKNR